MTATDTNLLTKVAELERELHRLKQTLVAEQQHGSVLQFPLEALLFRLGVHHFALQVQSVIEVIPMVTVTPLPGGPAAVRGTITFRGDIVPVTDLALSFSQGAKSLSTDMLLIVVQAGRRMLAIPGHEVIKVGSYSEADATAAPDMASRPAFVAGLVRDDMLVVAVLDPEHLLVASELDTLDSALDELAPPPEGTA